MDGLKKLALAAMAVLAVPQLFSQASVVGTEAGKLQGVTQGPVESFKGVPFAAPPVGDLRWRAPQPVQPWFDVRQANAYSADCMQVPFPSDAAPLGTKPAEDCLYLNVWRPASTKADAKLPVMFWIYGGGFVNGGSSPTVYDGSKFAEKGVVFVSANYRLGHFGFFAFPELTRENADGMVGNYGFMDQIAALRWVQKNISAFGGDPSNVTVFGESAGGFSVSMLLTSPLTQGLFSRAIIESGGGRTNLGGPRYLNTALPNGPPSAESVGIEFARSVGVDGTGKDALDQLRHLSAEKVLGNLNMATMNQPGYAGPIIDGRVVVSDPQSVYLAGAGWHVPIMIGTNSMDIGFGFAPNKEALFAPFGANREKAIAAYDPDRQWRPTSCAVPGLDGSVYGRARSLRGQRFRFGRPPCLRVQVFICRKVHAQQMAGRAPCNRDPLCLRYGSSKVWEGPCPRRREDRAGDAQLLGGICQDG